jgi:hypothetical protein
MAPTPEKIALVSTVDLSDNRQSLITPGSVRVSAEEGDEVEELRANFLQNLKCKSSDPRMRPLLSRTWSTVRGSYPDLLLGRSIDKV